MRIVASEPSKPSLERIPQRIPPLNSHKKRTIQHKQSGLKVTKKRRVLNNASMSYAYLFKYIIIGDTGKL